MGGATLNSGGVPVPVTYHHQVSTAQPTLYRMSELTSEGTVSDQDPHRSASVLLSGSRVRIENAESFSGSISFKLMRMTFICCCGYRSGSGSGHFDTSQDPDPVPQISHTLEKQKLELLFTAVPVYGYGGGGVGREGPNFDVSLSFPASSFM
jgi:hypothetical protein